MPELPDVEVFRKYLESTSLHWEIKRVELAAPEMVKGITASRLRKALRGNQIESARRHGKHLFARLKSGPWLVFHFGMTGFLAYFRDPERAPSHQRLSIRFKNGYTLAYACQRKLGEIALIDDKDRFIEEKNLGPDPLDDRFDLETFRNVITGTRATVKSALMNQKKMAGIGNIYSDEILFQAGIHPRTKTADLDDEDVAALYSKMTKRVLPAAIEARAQPDDLPGSFLIPHRHIEGKCSRCGGALEKARVAGRTAYYCPEDQPAQ